MAAADPFNPIPNPKISTYYQTKAAHTTVVTKIFLARGYLAQLVVSYQILQTHLMDLCFSDKLGGGEYKGLSYTHIKGGTSAVKKRGQGKAKGINAGDGEKQVEIYDGKIITPKTTQEITILFHQQLNGMVDKWMEGDWGDISLINKGNRNKSEIFSTTGSVPMAKYRYEMDGTSRDEKDNSNNNKEVENSLEVT
nr:hypothetical protein CFP56_67957 [Quercus suber]